MDESNIVGTGWANTKAGVEAFRREVRMQERERIERNAARDRGDFRADVAEARRVLEVIDSLMVHDWEDRAALAVGTAHDAVASSPAVFSVFDVSSEINKVVQPLKKAMGETAQVAHDLANLAIQLDTVIKHMENGEPAA